MVNTCYKTITTTHKDLNMNWRREGRRERGGERGGGKEKGGERERKRDLDHGFLCAVWWGVVEVHDSPRTDDAILAGSLCRHEPTDVQKHSTSYTLYAGLKEENTL